MIRRPPRSPLFPYPTLSRSRRRAGQALPAAVAHVRDQLDVAKAALERSHPASHFRRSRQSEPPTSRSERRKDRKSTRLNSSHGYISYAVFCLKKKKKRYSTT